MYWILLFLMYMHGSDISFQNALALPRVSHLIKALMLSSAGEQGWRNNVARVRFPDATS